MNEQNFDNAYYYGLNPDVKLAVIAGRFASGFEHYIKYGQFEGRQARTIDSTSQYVIFTDPGTGHKLRSGARDGEHVIDKELTATGFLGVENVDWERIGGEN
jgi:hypothetical protein